MPSRNGARVVHLVNGTTDEYTAMARVIAPLVPAAAASGFATDVWLFGPEGRLSAELEQVGARIYRLPCLNHIGAASARLLLRAIAGDTVSVFHQHFGGHRMRYLLRRLFRAPVLVHVHTYLSSRERAIVRVAALWSASHAVAPSRAVAATIGGVPVSIVHPGVEISPDARGEHLGRRVFTIGCAARLAHVKGVDILIRAVAAPALHGVMLDVAGSGPDATSLRLLADELGVAERVRFLGWQPDIRSMMRTWSVFVQPSREEAFGIAAAEAMAEGLPVVATRIGGLPELVEHGRSGLLVPRDPGALASAVALLRLNPRLREAMGREGRAIVRRRCSTGRSASQIVEIYRQLSRRRRSA